jgi:error-prone DNA polymerase
MVNVICPPPVWERHRRVAVTAPALVVRGRIERTGAAGLAGGAGGAANLLAAGMRPLRVAASRTGTAASRDFR